MAKSFDTMRALDNSTLMIVDSLNLGFRWKHKGALEFCKEYMDTVESLRKSYNARHVVIACDYGSSAYRKQIFPEYKGNREEQRAQQTPEDALAFEIFIKEYSKTIDTYIEAGKYPVFKFHKVEADDIAAYIVKTLRKYPIINKVVLISSDKDWDLLVSEKVMRFSYVTRKEVTFETWEEHYDCAPEEYISIKCLQGDAGDNVPGVPGIGPKKAAALVKQYGSTYDIIANMPINSKYQHIKNLNVFGEENLMRNYQLMDLLEFCDEALGEENAAVIDKTLEEYLNAN